LKGTSFQFNTLWPEEQQYFSRHFNQITDFNEVTDSKTLFIYRAESFFIKFNFLNHNRTMITWYMKLKI